MPARTITLVRDGKSEATIVVAPDIGPNAAAAVKDLVGTIAKMSGAALPVLDDGAVRGTGPQIHIGRTAYAKEAGLTPTDLPVNGYRIVTVHAPSVPRLLITGTHSLGISHGVYDLLTNELGVMWGMPDPMFEDIPKRRTVEVGWIDRTEKPAFGFRVWSGNDPDWVRRNRIDDGGRHLPYYGHGHNLFRVFPPSKYKDHPEYYAMLKGQRRVPEQDGHTHIQPCLTNPDLIRITAETVRSFLDENPNVTTYSLCPNDSSDFCECPNCLALDEGMERYRGRRMTSDSYFHYINEVAKELLKTHPKRYVGVYAYWTTELPPRRIDRLPPNVVVYLTQDSSQYHDPDYEKRDHDLLERWSKAAHHLAVYDYYGLGWFTPRYYPTIIRRTLPYLPTVSVKGFYCETYAFWPHIGPHHFLATRLLWDVKTDPDKVLDEWFERMFGEAAPEMKGFYGVLEHNWMTRPRIGHWFQGLDCMWQQLLQWTPDAREEAWERINAAYAAAKSQKARERVDYVRRGHRVTYLLSLAHEKVHALKPDAPDLERAIREITALAADVVASFRTAIEPDLTYGAAYYRGERAEAMFNWWRCDLGIAIEAALAKKPDLRERLSASDPMLAEIFRTAADPDIRRRWEREHERMTTMELYR